MAEVRDWSQMRILSARVLQQRTGADVETWMTRIREEGPDDEAGLRAWLEARGVTGYARSLLLRERFGYPDFMTASADELVTGQYSDRPQLRPIYEAIVEAALGLGEVAVQTRKGYVSLVGPRRTFARVKASTKTRIDLGLRIDGRAAGGRLHPSRMHETMPIELRLIRLEDFDAEALDLLVEAYSQSC
jgi:hypothetical protein